MKNKVTIKSLYEKYAMVLLATFACLLWGSAFPVLKITYNELQLSTDDVYGRIFLAGLRFFFASMMIMVFYTFKYKKMPTIEKKSIGSIFVLGIFNTTLQYLFFYNGLANTSGVKSALLASSSTFFIIIFVHFIYKDDRLNINKIIGLCLGFLGILIVNFNQMGESFFNFKFFGEGLLLLASTSNAIATLMVKKLHEKVDVIALNGLQMFFGSTILLCIGIITKGYAMTFTVKAVILLVYTAFLSACAFTIWFKLLSRFAASKVSIYKFLIPVFGAGLSILFLPNEVISVRLLIALALVAVGIYSVNKKQIVQKNNNEKEGMLNAFSGKTKNI